MSQEVHFSSAKQDWTTPQSLFNTLDKTYRFTVDAAASDDNHLCETYFTEEDDALSKVWGYTTVFINPPYGRMLPKFVEKSYREYNVHGTSVLMLIPARPDTRYWHDYIFGCASVGFLKGRIKFGGALTSAPFPSALVAYGLDLDLLKDKLNLYVVQ